MMLFSYLHLELVASFRQTLRRDGSLSIERDIGNSNPFPKLNHKTLGWRQRRV